MSRFPCRDFLPGFRRGLLRIIELSQQIVLLRHEVRERNLAITRREDIRDLFVDTFYFGCEADDALNYTAFNTAANELGVALKAMFSSDLGHWDVVDFGEILSDAYAPVERGLMTEEDFRDFAFVNPVTFTPRMNPDYSKGTVVEGAVDALLRARGQAA
jgi:hypothetical protein